MLSQNRFRSQNHFSKSWNYFAKSKPLSRSWNQINEVKIRDYLSRNLEKRAYSSPNLARAKFCPLGPFIKIKAVPELDLPALVRPHSSGAPSVSSISTSIRSESRKIGREESCFITKGHAYSLEKAHFVNAVRHNENLKADVVSHLTFKRRPRWFQSRNYFFKDLGLLRQGYQLVGSILP